MKTKVLYSAIAALGLVLLNSEALGVPVSLGAAGPGNWAILEIGKGNISIANASSAGSIKGNVGVNGGNLSDSGTLITGNVDVSTTAGIPSFSPSETSDVTGTLSQDSTDNILLTSAADAAIAASAAAALLPSSGGGVGVSSIIYNNAGTIDLSAGVYNLSDLQLNGTNLDLATGSTYVFNISGSLALNSSKILDLTGANVLFNITGSQGAALSGGLSQESVLDGILLAPYAGVQVTSGLVVGEIISGGNVGIASGGQVQGISSVPDGGTTLTLLGIGLISLTAFRRRFAR
jgi:VPDSG-CTERM motif